MFAHSATRLSPSQKNAVASSVLAAAPRFGPGVEIRSLTAVAARRLNLPIDAVLTRHVRETTAALEQSWRVSRIPGSMPVRWRRIDAEDRLRFERDGADDGNDWPPM